jgi:hypothetical protein
MKQKKAETKNLKKSDERPAQKFKFGSMKKKDPFAIRKIEVKDEYPVHEPARDYREREALIFPDKVKNNAKKWNYQGHKKGYFSMAAGREVDQFDEEKVKFFNQPTRPLGSTTVAITKKNPDGTISKEMQSVKWNATKFRLDDLSYVPPLIDNTLTPRGREKAISLERNYEKKKKWIPNNFTLKEFKIKEKKSILSK